VSTGVGHRLARGLDKGDLRLGHLQIPNAYDINADAKSIFYLSCCFLERDTQRGRRWRRGWVKPATQVAFLRTGDPCYRLRVSRVALNQSQRLKDGVVNVCGDLGTFLAANPCATLGVPLAKQSQRKRTDDQCDAEDHNGHRGKQRTGLRDAYAANGEGNESDEHEANPECELPPPGLRWCHSSNT
jgi:hypothetical protein